MRESWRRRFVAAWLSRSGLAIIVTLALLLVVERQQRSAMFDQTQLRALSLATSLAAFSEGYLLVYNFPKLEQVAAKLTADDDDVMYTAIHLRDGTIAAYSEDRQFVALGDEGALQGKLLNDPVSQRALLATEPLVQRLTTLPTNTPGYDVAIPVYISESSQKWGTVRVGFSLRRASRTMQSTRGQLLVWGLLGIAFSLGVAAVLAERALRTAV